MEKYLEMTETRRKMEKEAEIKRRNALDDGTVRGLLLSRDYSKVGDYVKIQHELDEDTIMNVVSASRRKLKKDDIVLFSIMGDLEGGSGLVFTNEKIYYLWDEKIQLNVSYTEIMECDYNEGDEVELTFNDGRKEAIYVEGYAKQIYNLIMDIKDRLSGEL